MVDRDEVARRIKAGRLLRGMHQSELGRLLAKDGLGSEDVGRIERGDMEMQRVHRDAILRHLALPERWLTAESVDEIVGLDSDGGHDDDRAPSVETIEQLADQIRAVLAAIEQINGRLGRDLGRRDVRGRAARGRRPEAPGAEALTGG